MKCYPLRSECYAEFIGPESSQPFILPQQLHLGSLTAEDIRVTSIENCHSAAAEELTASSAELNLKRKSKQLIPSKVIETLSLGKPSGQTSIYWASPRRQKSGRWASFYDKRDVLCTYVVTGEVMDVGLGQHGVVLELTLAERRGVTSDDDELGLSGSKGLEGRFVSEGD